MPQNFHCVAFDLCNRWTWRITGSTLVPATTSLKLTKIKCPLSMEWPEIDIYAPLVCNDLQVVWNSHSSFCITGLTFFLDAANYSQTTSHIKVELRTKDSEICFVSTIRIEVDKRQPTQYTLLIETLVATAFYFTEYLLLCNGIFLCDLSFSDLLWIDWG